MESTVKTLKINATNIKSVLINGNKNLKKLRVDERTLLEKQQVERKRQQKEAFVESQKTGGGVMGNIGARLMSGPMSLLDKIKEFFGNILLGILINNLPMIYNKINKFLEDNKDTIETIKSVVIGLGNSLVGFVTFIKGVTDGIGNIGKQWNEIEKDLDEMLKTDGILSSLTQGLMSLDGLFRSEFSDLYIQRDPEQVREDVKEEVRGAQIPRETFEKRLNEYRKAKTTVNVTQKVTIPGLGTYQRKRGGILNAFQIVEEATDSYGAPIPAQEFDTRFLNVVGNLDSIYQGFSQGGTVRPALGSSGGSFSGESATLKNARASTQTFSLFDINEQTRSGIIGIQEETNKTFEELIKNFGELFGKKEEKLPVSSPYELPPTPPGSPPQQGPTILPPGVTTNDVIGYVGNTGLSGGAHIHLEDYDVPGASIPDPLLDKIYVNSAPMSSGTMTSGIGWRLHPVTGEWRKHQGEDWDAGWENQPITLGNGVKFIKFVPMGSDSTFAGYGNVTVIEYNNKRYFLAHLNKGPNNLQKLLQKQKKPSGGSNITPAQVIPVPPGMTLEPVGKPKGYGKGGASNIKSKGPDKSRMNNLTQYFDGEGMTEVIVINSTQPIIVPGPTRYIRR